MKEIEIVGFNFDTFEMGGGFIVLHHVNRRELLFSQLSNILKINRDLNGQFVFKTANGKTLTATKKPKQRLRLVKSKKKIDYFEKNGTLFLKIVKTKKKQSPKA